MQLYINYQGKTQAWDLASLPSSIHNFKMNLGHIKYHLFPSNNIAFFCLTQLSVDVFFTKLQHSGGRSVCTAAAPHNTPQNTNCETLCSKSCCDKYRIVPTLFLRLFDNCSLKLRHGAGAMTHNCCSWSVLSSASSRRVQWLTWNNMNNIYKLMEMMTSHGNLLSYTLKNSAALNDI